MAAKRVAEVMEKGCVACGACMAECKLGAIGIVSGCYAKVNPDKCVGCGMCEKICPAGCIQLKNREVIA